jgi:hypothetical protein
MLHLQLGGSICQIDLGDASRRLQEGFGVCSTGDDGEKRLRFDHVVTMQ